MSEYISRNEVYQKLHEAGGCDATDEWSKGYDAGITEAIDIIDNIPTADVAPIVHGRWLWMTKKEAASYSSLGFVVDSENWRCSQCNKHGAGRWWARDNKFCPNCGAKMDESEEEECLNR